MGMTLDDLLARAHADGVTMINLDVTYCGAWHKRHRKYFTARGKDQAEALRNCLEVALSFHVNSESNESDEDILI